MKGALPKLSRRALRVGLVLVLSSIFSLTTDRALAHQPPPPDDFLVFTHEGQVGQTVWLILDAARPVDETLPRLLDLLAAFKSNGVIIAFDRRPQVSAPQAAPGLRVIAPPEMTATLQRLPGVLAAAAELPPPPADPVGGLSATGIVSGQLTDADTGQPLANQLVLIYDAVSFAYAGFANSNAEGVYSATVTAPYNQVKVQGAANGYIRRWYGGQDFFSQATALPLSGASQLNVNIALRRGGVISGSLNFEGGQPATDVWATVYKANNSFSYVASANADENGRFVISGLKSNSYKVHFSGGNTLEPEWYQDQPTSDTAVPLLVTEGSTTTLTAVLKPGGVITGVLTDGSTGQPVRGLDVNAISQDRQFAYIAYTDAEGQYRLTGLPAGAYKILIAPSPWPLFGENAYRRQYIDNQLDFDSTAPINVTPGQTTPNINATLTPTGTGDLAGQLTKNGGVPPAAGEARSISLYDPEIERIGYATINLPPGDGATTTYSLTDLRAGQYKLWFGLAGRGFGGEFYNDQAAYADATPVTIAAGGVALNINADVTVSLNNQGGISGTLTHRERPVNGQVIVAFTGVGDEIFPKFRRSYVDPDEQGRYLSDLLEPGNYLVSFSQFPSATTWYPAATSRAAAQPVTVTAGQITGQINGTLDALGACISGKIFNKAGQGANSAMFEVYDAEDQAIHFWAGLNGVSLTDAGVADEDGAYIACGLAAGLYTIKATVAGNRLQSAPTSVTGGQVQPHINFPERAVYLPLLMKRAD